MLDTPHQDLISTIYAATLAPHDFDQMVDDLEAHVTPIVTQMTGRSDVHTVLPDDAASLLNSATLSDLLHHIETATRIQSQMGFHADEQDRLDALLSLIPNPAIIFDQDERILRRNARAEQSPCARSTSLAELFINAEQLTDIRRAMRKVEEGEPFAAVPLSLECEKTINDCAIIKRIDITGTTARDHQLYMISLAHFTFDRAVSTSFQAAYHLTDAEAAVAIHLASGTKTSEIARLRRVSQQTIRTQIKSIKSKTHVRDLPDLVRLLCGFSAGMAQPGERQGVGGRRSALRSHHHIQLPDGRRLDYLIQGDPAGAPVLLFHGLPHGIQLPEAAIRYARRNGLKLIAPCRPGTASSDPLPDLTGTSYLDQVADDTQHLCDTLSISTAKLLGFAGGATFALRYATNHRDRVSNIVMIGHAPLWHPQRLGQLAQRQRLISLLTRYMPQLAHVLAGAILTSISKHDHGRFAKEVCDGSPADLRVLETAENSALMEQDIKVTLKCTPETLLREWALLETDLSDDAKNLPHPLHLLHGEEDQVFTPDFSRQFAAAVPQTKLQIIKGAGHYLLHSHWQQIMNTLHK